MPPDSTLPPRLYGLVGKALGHSLSPQFFNEKFLRLGLPHRYQAFELPTVEGVADLIGRHPDLCGFNVTVPYKQAIVPLLTEVVGPAARATGAVNCVAVASGRLLGYNTDVAGVWASLEQLLPTGFRGPALVLGTGGAAQAVGYALAQWARGPIPFRYVSRSPGPGVLAYTDLTPDLVAETPLLVQTTPLGMYPAVEGLPKLPYAALGPGHFLLDLVYNPRETRFLAQGRAQGAQVLGGLPMLYAQAEASWAIWNGTAPPTAG